MEYSDRGMLKMEPSAKRTTEAIYGCAERGLVDVKERRMRTEG